jgi:Fic family protein
MTDRDAPPYHITPGILHSIEQIGEALGYLRVGSDSAIVPVLPRGNRIKTIQASLAIEGNTLSLEQVTAVLAGKRVLAQSREIHEVRNASDQESDHQSNQVMRLHKSWRSYAL